jgi:hypothetical protein
MKFQTSSVIVTMTHFHGERMGKERKKERKKERNEQATQ